MSEKLEALGEDPPDGRPCFLLRGAGPSAWDVSGEDLGLFTLLLAIDADRYPDEQLSAFAERFRRAGLGIDEESSEVERPFLTTTDHEDEPLAEALWFAIDLAFHEDVRHPSESAVVIGTDRDEWAAEVRARLADPDELRRYVVEDLP